MSEVSVPEAAREAWDLTAKRLFPFRLDVWLVLGFMAFLDQCGRGGGFPVTGGQSLPTPNPMAADLESWSSTHVALLVILAGAVLAVVIAIAALVTWINSRGTFLYIDAVARGSLDIGASFAAHAEEANSFFTFRFLLGLSVLSGFILSACFSFILLRSAFRNGFGAAAAVWVVFVVFLALVLAALAVALVLFSILLRDFVAPIQYCRSVPTLEGVRLLVPLLAPHFIHFVLYLVLKFVFRIVVASLAFFLACVSCCLLALPVVSQTVLQPALYFERAWSLALLRQLGFDVFRSGEGAKPGA